MPMSADEDEYQKLQKMTPKTIAEGFRRAEAFFHSLPKAPVCEHDFQGWRKFEDGRGGERVCTKCGMGAMAHTLSLDI